MTVKRGFFRTVLDAMIESRRREAQRMVEVYEARHGNPDGHRHISAGY